MRRTIASALRYRRRPCAAAPSPAPPPPAPPRTRDRAGRGAETATAAGLAAAQLAANGIAVIFTVILARLLGREDYGALAARSRRFLIVSVPGYALQVAAARATRPGGSASHETRATLRRWTRRIRLATVGLAVGALLREPLARLMGVDEAWAAAAMLPTGGLWLLLSIQRGTLAGLGAYRPVGVSIVAEAAGRLVLSVGLVVAGLGTAGAYLGTPLAFAATALVLGVVLARRTPGRQRAAHGLAAARAGARGGDPDRRARADRVAAERRRDHRPPPGSPSGPPERTPPRRWPRRSWSGRPSASAST